MAEPIVKDNTQNNPTDDVIIEIDPNLDAEARAKALEEQNKKLYARAKKAEGFIQDADGKWIKKPVETKPDPIIKKEEQTKPSDILKADEFKLYRAGYTEDEIDLIMHNGGMKALENPKSPLSLGLKAAREQREAEEAAGKVQDTSGLSEVERKYTVEQLKKMSVKELEAILPHAPAK